MSRLATARLLQRLCEGKGTLIKADGANFLSVALQLPSVEKTVRESRPGRFAAIDSWQHVDFVQCQVLARTLVGRRAPSPRAWPVSI
jgi:hypothetical protein